MDEAPAKHVAGAHRDYSRCGCPSCSDGRPRGRGRDSETAATGLWAHRSRASAV